MIVRVGPASDPVLALLAAMTAEEDPFWWRTALGGGSELRATAQGVERRSAPWQAWLPLRRWLHPTPAEALEALLTAGLAPAAEASRWACPWCETREGGPDEWTPPPGCAPGHDAHPPDHATLYAVAALGPDRWARAEALARVVLPGADVTWRAWGAEERRRWAYMRSQSAPDVPRDAVEATAHEIDLGVREWGDACPSESSDLRRAWPALRDLNREMGAAVVRLEPGRVTLAVEAAAL